MVFYFSAEVFLNNDPRVIDTKYINKISKNYTFSKKNLEFFISLEYSNSTYYLDETVYKVSAIMSEINFIKINGTVKQVAKDQEINLVKCSDIYRLEEIEKFNVAFPHKLFYCLPPNTSSFGGFWGSDYFASLKIYIKKCSNNTLLPGDLPCKDIEAINKIINNGAFSRSGWTVK